MSSGELLGDFGPDGDWEASLNDDLIVPVWPLHSGPPCPEDNPESGLECTRVEGHEGRRVACGLTRVWAVWS